MEVVVIEDLTSSSAVVEVGCDAGNEYARLCQRTKTALGISPDAEVDLCLGSPSGPVLGEDSVASLSQGDTIYVTESAEAFARRYLAGQGYTELSENTASEAAGKGDTTALRSLATLNVPIIKRGGFRTDILHCAAYNGHLETVEHLIEMGASIQEASCWRDVGSHESGTALHAAVVGKHDDIVSVLLNKYGADSSIQNNNGYTPLYLACLKGQMETVTLLLQHGAELNREYPRMDTPLAVACRGGYVALVAMLLKEGAKVGCGTPLHSAASGGHIEVAHLLFEAGVDVCRASEENGNTALLCSLRNDRVAMSMLLMEHGADPLQLATPKPCSHAACFGAGVCRDDCGRALHLAVGSGDAGLVQYLISKGCKSRNGCKEGVKPLHTAVMSDSESVCTRVLLENAVQAEVEVDEEKDTGECALAVAARLGNVACTATLLGFGASVDKIDTLNGWTPLHYACFHDKPAVVRLLLQAGADASRLDKYGKAPLHMAAFNGSVDVLGHLLDFKAVPCKNADGWLPHRMAKACGHHRAAALLEEAFTAKGSLQ